MKIKDLKRPAMLFLLVLTCQSLATGCLFKGDEVKFAKVPDAESASAGCAQSQGLDPELAKQLTEALKDYGGVINDEFKLKASALVTESDSVPAQQRNQVLKEYFSCLSASAPAEKK
ncbi:MAG: hypothetical protein AB1598_05075 [Thermodesulfobacteriota bacterium]